jgi:hypothetical protein
MTTPNGHNVYDRATVECERRVDTAIGPNRERIIIVDGKNDSQEANAKMMTGHLVAIEWWIRDSWGLTQTA